MVEALRRPWPTLKMSNLRFFLILVRIFDVDMGFSLITVAISSFIDSKLVDKLIPVTGKNCESGLA
jgi:hypothetical protein